MMITATALLALFLASPLHAAKDDSYYIAGTGNPNKNEKMYWKDAENVFQDLSSFSQLYVEFHNCAWTWMMTSEEDNDIDENDYWYMGKIPPMGANVAYSLYGSLKGETFSGCDSNSFINSFYTNTGFTNFARAMNYAGLSGFSSYSYDDDSSSSYTASCSGGYGVGCDYSNGFAVHSYSGSECNPANYTGVKDSMSSLNSAMKSAQCIKIYDSSSYGGSPYGTPLELLAYSHSCFYQDFFSPDGVCPDPYGKLQYYQQQFYNGIQESKKLDPYMVSRRKQQYYNDIEHGKVMCVVGLFLIGVSLVSAFVDLVIWCCFTKRKTVVQKQVPVDRIPGEDDILTKRRESGDADDTDTDAAGSRSTADGGYITMKDEDEEGDVEAPAAPYRPPIDATPPSKEEQDKAVDQVKAVLPPETAKAIENYVREGIKIEYTQSMPAPRAADAAEEEEEVDFAPVSKSVDAVDNSKSVDAVEELKASISPEAAKAIEEYIAQGVKIETVGSNPGKEMQANVAGEADPVTVYTPPALEPVPAPDSAKAEDETEPTIDKVIASRDSDSASGDDNWASAAMIEGVDDVKVAPSDDTPILEKSKSEIMMLAFDHGIKPKKLSVQVPPKASLLDMSENQLMSQYFDVEEGPSEAFKVEEKETADKETTAAESTPAEAKETTEKKTPMTVDEAIANANAVAAKFTEEATTTSEQATPGVTTIAEEPTGAEEATTTSEQATAGETTTAEESAGADEPANVEGQATSTAEGEANASTEAEAEAEATTEEVPRQKSWFRW